MWRRIEENWTGKEVNGKMDKERREWSVLPLLPANLKGRRRRRISSSNSLAHPIYY